MAIAVDVFSGFLGAGKTMLIKKMISEGVYEKDLAIIENEFGEVAIDGIYLKESGVQIKEIASGCICCSVTGDFKQAILELTEQYPIKRIIIEPSGVAALSDVLKVFKESALREKLVLNRVITVVDTTRFEMYQTNFSAFYKNQIQNAKTIVLSRTQLVTHAELEIVVKQIRALNHTVAIVTTPWDKLSASVIANANEENFKEELIKKVRQNARSIKKVAGVVRNTSAHDVFDTFGINMLSVFDEDKINYMLKALQDTAKYGEILRAKGIICNTKDKWIEFDYVTGECEVRATKPYYTGKLCVIGTRLNKKALQQLLEG
ncbi:CobW family GTP-binding protein [Cellulosilyticum sp. I15G10I2]|uniref:CobW family GTP-binding protein n=1 Tax=Cellulosilyticum sp. I15G10I2 TaxID=1892843 RepID=UPI00085C66B8|nr:GTP-binding protein [Cellulosilyticum sp. I15G10I2]